MTICPSSFNSPHNIMTVITLRSTMNPSVVIFVLNRKTRWRSSLNEVSTTHLPMDTSTLCNVRTLSDLRLRMLDVLG
ncbi:hypothetical protein C5167_029833 [Papaver somniferum]|nr:hypothetical protein C5167_029833 [Papaver somniferum]